MYLLYIHLNKLNDSTTLIFVSWFNINVKVKTKNRDILVII